MMIKFLYRKVDISKGDERKVETREEDDDEQVK